MSEINIGARKRIQISEDDLAAKIMQMLHERPPCTDARSVMLECIREDGKAYNWRIGHFDPGRGDRYRCKIALRRIHEALRETYEVVG